MKYKTIQQGTVCGLAGSRAKVIAQDGNKLTYRWPCGYEKTEVMTIGHGHLKKPADAATMKFFSRYWANGVTYQCPRCLREAKKAKRIAAGR